MPQGSQFSALDSRDIQAVFAQSYEEAADGSWAPQVALPVDSDRKIENYDWLGSPGGPREWVGGRQARALKKYSQTLENKLYEHTLDLPVLDLRRDKTGQLARKISDLGRSTATFPEDLVSTLITANGLCYDGQNFFDTDHNESGSNQVNALTNSHIPAADVATATAPTSTEMAQVLSQAITYMMGYTNDAGLYMNGGASSFLVLSGTATISGAMNQAVNLMSLGTAGIDNPLRAFRSRSGQLVIDSRMNPRLSSLTTKLWIFRTDGTMKPFIHQVEQDWEDEILAEGSDHAFNTKAYQFGVNASMTAGYGFWQSAVQITLS